MTVIAFAPGLKPMLKHGDPSRPGYAQQHPGSAAAGAPAGDREARAATMKHAESAYGIDMESGMKEAELKASIAERIEERLQDISTDEMLEVVQGSRTAIEDEYEMREAIKPDDLADKADDILALPGETSIKLYRTDMAPEQGLLGEVPMPIGTPSAEVYVRRSITSRLIRQWAVSSNDDEPLSLALQSAARKEFGLDDADEWKGASLPTQRKAQEILDGSEKFLRRFVRVQYEETQAMLAEQGVSAVTLYRGIREGVSRSTYAGTVRTRPMSSWSYSKEIADNFSDTRKGGLLRAIVPARRILATAASGIGCWNEKEMVVLGGVIDAELVR